VQRHGLQLLKRIMALNVLLGVLAYRDLLTFQPRMYSASTTLSRDAEQYLFTPTETAPLIIVLLSLWLLFHRRAALFALPRRSGPIWLVALLLGLGSAIFTWAVYTRSPDIQAFSLIVNLVGCAILWRGVPAARLASVPIALLVFAIPLPSPLIAKLIWEFQLNTAVLAGWLLYLIGIPAVVLAEVIRLPEDTYQVIESCSGLRSVQTLAMFSILMADLFDRGKWHTLCLFSASIPIAFLMNGLRVTTLILNPHSQIHSIHVGQGLVVLMGGLILLYLIDGQLPRIFGRANTALPSRFAQEPTEHESGRAEIPALQRALVVTCLTLLMIGTLYLLPTWKFHGFGGASVDLVLAEALTGWRSQALAGATNDLAKVSFRESHRRRYSRPSADSGPTSRRLIAAAAPVELFVGVGEHLDRFRTPFSPKTAFPGRGWVVEDLGQIRLEGTEVPITWRLIRAGTQRAISYHWFEQDRGLLEESIRSSLALDRSPFVRKLPVMAVRIATEIAEVTPSEIRRAHDRLTEFHGFVAGAIDTLQGSLGAAENAKTSRLLNFPLWESFFPSAVGLGSRNTSKIGRLMGTGPVA